MKITPDDIRSFISEHPLALIYFKGDRCSICRQLGPEIAAFAQKQEIPLLEVDMPSNPGLAASEMVLSVPVIKLYFEGNEVFKEGAYFRYSKLREMIEKIRTFQS